MCNFQNDSWWDVFSLEICILFAFLLMQLSRSYWLWHFKVIVRIWAHICHIKLSPFYYKANVLKNRFTSLATTVYLSHPLSPTPSHDLPSNRFSECIRNKGCFIFLQEIEIGNDIPIYIKIKNEFSRHIFITHAASETLKCLNATEHDSYISISTQ